MTFLYHRVPEQMIGDVLYPLNQLKDLHPNVYAEQIKKYEGREFVMEQQVPILNCLWNDALHFSAVHPQKIADELEKLGQSLLGKKFYIIHPEKLEKEKAVVYLYKHKSKKDKLLPENWTEFRIEDIDNYTELPEKTIEYYKDQLGQGKKPLLWAWVPHIMYQGTLDVSDCEVAKVI